MKSMMLDGLQLCPTKPTAMNDSGQEPVPAPSEPIRTVQGSVLRAIAEQVETSFESCRRSAEKPLGYSYRIGDIPISLRFWGSSLIPIITPALRHLLAAKTVGHAFTIHLWDGTPAGNSFPAIEKDLSALTRDGEAWAGTTTRYQMFFQPSIGLISLVDNMANRAYFWARNASAIPYYESGAPLRRILYWWMGRHGYQLLHAASVGTGTAGVLLVGKGGSGKSTTALACLRAGLLYASDDYCMVTTHPGPVVHSIFSSGKLHAEDVERFPEFHPALSNPERLRTEKALYYFFELFPERVSRGFPLCAILIPELARQMDTTVETVPAATGYLALAPSTLLQLQDKKGSSQSFIGALARRLPSFRLKVGSDIEKTPIAIRRLIATLSSS